MGSSPTGAPRSSVATLLATSTATTTLVARGCRRRCGRDASGATIGTVGWPRAARATTPMLILGGCSVLRSLQTSVDPRPLTTTNIPLFERRSQVRAQSPLFRLYVAECDLSLVRHEAWALACCGLQMMCTVHRTEFAARLPRACPLCFARVQPSDRQANSE